MMDPAPANHLSQPRRTILAGVAYAPLIVTAIDRGAGLTVRCPACGESLDLARSQLDVTITCPQLNCGMQLHINHFLTAMS